MIGREFRRIRLKAGWTQEQVAARAGMSREYIGRLERGKKIPNIFTFVLVCRALKVPPEVMIKKVDQAMRNKPGAN